MVEQARDWAADVRKYAPDADEAVIAGIVRHCGIALQNRDSALVSFSDPAETRRVRESYLRRKLALTESDADLDAAIAQVGERMREDQTKNRVTVYYLLAEHFGKLGLFGAAASAAAVSAAAPATEPGETERPAPPPPPVEARPVAAPASALHPTSAATAAAAAPLAAAAPAMARPGPHRTEQRDDGGLMGVGLGTLGVLGAGILLTAIAATLVSGSAIPDPLPAPTVVPGPRPGMVIPAPAVPVVAAAPAFPDGAGVVLAEVAGRPQVSVYFDTARADVAPDFATVAAPVATWMEANPSDMIAVSGFNDPRGDAAFNAELSRNRAQNVAAALAALGIAPGRVRLERPAATTDATTTLENARRVDIMIRDGG